MALPLPRRQEYPAPPAHCRLLLRALVDVHTLRYLGPADWDLLIRVARRARLHGVLHARLQAAGLSDVVPDRALAHLESGAAVARHRQQMARLEQHHLAQTLQPLGVPLVLLKGAAYLAQDMSYAQGRPLNDIDLMVPAAQLESVEAALRTAGWRSQIDDAYDERYYREWSHEVPPLRGPGRDFEVDLHHAILPPTSRLKPDTARLFAAAVPLPGTPWSVLAPADQVLHAALHLFQDTDAGERLRDLVDIDCLLRAYAALPGFWQTLWLHAAHHGLLRPLWYALHYSRAWLHTPVESGVLRALTPFAPSRPLRVVMDHLFVATLFPLHPDRGNQWHRRLAWEVLRLRAIWLRMPPGLFMRHGVMRLVRRWRSSGTAAA